MAPAQGPVLAIARDAAFSFYYEDDLDLLASEGVRLAPFSPVAGDRLPEGRRASTSAAAIPNCLRASWRPIRTLWRDLRDLHERGAPILAECGGFMALTEALIDGDGVCHRMAGLVPGAARMTPSWPPSAIGEATALIDTLLARQGETLRGHEFHYSVWDVEAPAVAGVERCGRPPRGAGSAGHAERGLLASYLHVPLAQRPGAARRLAEALRVAGR